MSKFDKIVEANSVHQLNDIPEGTIIFFNNEKDTSLVCNHTELENKLNKIFADPKIGFVYTDVLVRMIPDMEFIEFLSGTELPNIAFFMRKIDKPINVKDEATFKINIMQKYIQYGYHFVHIAEPLMMMQNDN